MEQILETKVCNYCCEEKPLSEFYSQNRYSKKRGNYTYYNTRCKGCEITLAWQNLLDNWERGKRQREEYEKRQGIERTLNKRKNAERQRLAGKQKQWQIDNPDKLSQYNQKRKHKNHKVSKSEWIACKEYFNNSCAYCGLSIEEHFRNYAGKPQKIDLHKEHADHEGSSGLDNCIPSCQSCNDKKWKFKLEEWYNEDNPIFSQERLDKIHKWLDEDYKKYLTI